MAEYILSNLTQVTAVKREAIRLGGMRYWGMVCWRIKKVSQHVVNILCHGDFYIYCRLQETRQSIRVRIRFKTMKIE